jgi:hypothetical protein
LNRQDIYDNDPFIFDYFDRHGPFCGVGRGSDAEGKKARRQAGGDAIDF